MDRQIRAIVNVCPEETAKNMDSVRSEFRAWASSMRVPSEMDEGGALSLKTQFVTFMKNGKHGRQIEDYREVGERLVQWARTRTEPIEALRSYMGTEWMLAQEIERSEKRRDPSPYRAPAKRARGVPQGA
jgi:hypothetical protein